MARPPARLLLPLFALWLSSAQAASPPRRSLACSCRAPATCGCCAPFDLGANKQTPAQAKAQHTACVNLNFHPETLSADAVLQLDGQTLAEATLTGGDPAPLCLPLPQFPPLALCARLSHVGLTPPPQGGLRACVDLELQLGGAPLLVARFQCVRVGAGGLSLVPRPPDAAQRTALTKPHSAVIATIRLANHTL